MKLTVPVLAGAGILFAVSCLTGCKSNPTPPIQSPAPPPQPPPKKFIEPSDTPINIGGDSIYGCFQNGWQPAPPGQPYDYTASSQNPGDIDQISTTGISGINPTVSTNGNGWVIQLSNSDHQNPNKPAAVTISSDPSRACLNDPQLTNCKSPSIGGDSKTVYLRLRSDMRATPNPNPSKNLRFHDKKCDGASGTGEDRNCDYPKNVTITSQGTQTSGQCAPWPGGCSIGIGPDVGVKCVHN